MSDRVVMTTLTVEDLRHMVAEAAEEGARRALSSMPTSRLTKSHLAVALGRSPSTIDRYVLEGMPCEDAGTRRMFDLEACRAWLRGRPSMRKNLLNEGVVRKSKVA
jgi:hypothetical protein